VYITLSTSTEIPEYCVRFTLIISVRYGLGNLRPQSLTHLTFVLRPPMFALSGKLYDMHV